MGEGNENAFSHLYKHYSPAIFGFIKRSIADTEIAGDILQEVFIKIFRNIKQYDSSKGRLYTWMINIARNQVCDHLRSSGFKMQMQNRSLEDSVNTINEQVQTETETSAIGVKELLDKLPETQSELLDLVYFKGYTQQEVAENLQLPLGTVKTRIRNGIGTLKKYFGER